MYPEKQVKELQALTKKISNSGGTIEQLRNVIRFHEFRYYVLNDPLVSDKEYDDIFNKLEVLEENDPSLITADSPTQRVGSTLNGDFVTVPHLVPMLSLDNSYNAEDLVDWDKRVKGFVSVDHVEYSAEPKFDGASFSLIYENDLLVRGATRGDGIAGDDITNNVRQIGSIPLSANFSKFGIQKIEVRGEVLITKENFRRYNENLSEEGLPPLANPRNAAAGSLRMKDPASVRKRKLEAILYNISLVELQRGKSQPELLRTHSGSLELLSQLGFKTPAGNSQVFVNIENVVTFCEKFEKQRDDLPYEIDGMVIKVNAVGQQLETGSTTHHPRWAMAYKFKARQATSRLLRVGYQVGRTGSITPVAKIEPVPIGGVTVGSISLFNADIIREKDLRIGDTVLVERAGDVIPYIVKSFPDLRTGTEEEILFPTTCPVCGDPLVKPESEAVWRCVNINCEAQVVERIIHFVSKDAMDIRSLGEANVRKFYGLKLFHTIPGIYQIDFEAVAGLEGFGEKSVTNLKTAIEKSKKQPLHRLIFGLGIRYVGETTAKILARSVDDLLDLARLSREELQQLQDIGIKVSESIFEFFSNTDNLKMLEELRATGLSFKGEKRKQTVGILDGNTFIFTGTLPTLKRNEAEKMAEEKGGKILSGVSSNLTYLVAGEAAGSKLDKARKITSIKIIDEAEFLNLVQS